MASKPRTVEEIFKDYRARRIAIIRALTRDIDELYGLCDPGKENLCLYGHPNEAWEVTLPSEEVPPELPEPALGINFARDDVSRKDWLSLVAVHSDSWLLSVAFYLGTRLSHNERKRLFGLINALPTIFQVVTSNKKIKDKFTMNSGNKSWGSTEAVSRKLRMVKSPVFLISHQGILLEKPTTNIHTRGNENVDIICGSCSEKYNKNEFWIGCDICEWWYHGKCVMMTPIKAETLKHYKCPSCCLRRGRP